MDMTTRLFVHHRTPPHFNMGFDEWMLAEAAATPGLILLRLYTWEIGTITFGFNQRQQTALDFTKLGSTPVIRRITGGRAVYHDISELTYAVAFNTAEPATDSLRGSTAQTSERIARMLSRFLSHVGFTAGWVRTSAAENGRPDYFHKAACFASHAKYELVAGGAKIVASARRDFGGAALQHGAIKISGLASHPALHNIEAIPASPLKSIDLSVLNDMAGRFSDATEEELNIVTLRSEPAVAECRAIFLRSALVRERPLGKRELIEQTAAIGSQ